VLSVFIATLETANMSLDFEQLYDLSSKTKSKEEFNKVLDMYFTTFKEDYMDRIDTQNEKIQEMIEEELKSLNPDISRLKDEKSTEKLLKIIVPEVIEDKDESMNNIGTKIKN
jgi:6-pyruvoyl-tetrahydropterin synthase